MKQTLITLLFFFTGFTVLAQVGIGTQTPQATLDITGNQGLLIPRMTDHTVLTPIDGTLDANEKGLQVYNTTTNTIMVWDGVSWNGMVGCFLGIIVIERRSFNLKSHINLKYSPVYSIFTFINNNLLISEIKLH